jgi:SAF domain-containing protein
MSDSGTMSNVEFPSPHPRRISTPRWFDLRLVLGVVLVLAAVLVGALVVARARHTDKELAVTHDLAAGTTLQATDVRLVDVQLPDDVRHDAGYLSDPAAAVGKVLNRPLRRGELVPAAVVSAAGGAQTTVSVPFAADAAPALTRGERIVVWLSTPSCPSVVLLPDVTVQDVRAATSGGFSTSGTGQDVVVSVVPTLAQRVVAALAIPDATIRAGVLTGARKSTGTTSSGTLPPLDECAPSPTP